MPKGGRGKPKPVIRFRKKGRKGKKEVKG